MVKYSRTHSADFVPCFVAFEANVRQYAALAVTAMSLHCGWCLREGVPGGSLSLEHVQARQSQVNIDAQRFGQAIAVQACRALLHLVQAGTGGKIQDL
jgi:hypothetical protein